MNGFDTTGLNKWQVEARCTLQAIDHDARRALPWHFVDHRDGAVQPFKTVDDARHWAKSEGIKFLL